MMNKSWLFSLSRWTQSLSKEAKCARAPILHLSKRSSAFKAPTRPDLKTTESETTYAKGRENPMLFCEEYIPPQVQPDWHRNKLKYRLERMDCLRRRKAFNIPEFYPGSIVAVTVADKHAPGKSIRFNGRVLYKDGFGLGCKFALRNVIDGEGIEVVYHLYGPYIQKMEVLHLEKWVDTDLRYLRDADPSYCTIDPDMQPKALPPTSVELELFRERVKLNKSPRWQFQYQKHWPPPYNADFQSHFLEDELIESERFSAMESWRKYDICRHYDVTEMKEEIVAEMKANKSRIEKADSTLKQETS
uniref:Large ribosomal subunit protein bL19m n=1 Tax=Phallusia mammillata TaxID=59560 RepID=A0A6F9DLX1_9ASCI|nr:39S ribosomal protein L19, mitochondrial-like [Phallusia mammillata]